MTSPKKHQWIKNDLALIIAIILLIVTGAAIIPGDHNFEGNIIAEEMGFVYNGEQSKVLIENIADIQKLENEGRQTLTFTGKLESKSLPKLNQLKSLAIQLPTNRGKWIITSADQKKASKIRLENLRIEPGAKLIALNYDFYRQLLSFSLTANKNPNTLTISLGTQPIKINLENYKILNLPNQTDDGKPLEFILTPDNSEFNLTISNRTKFYISLAKPTKFDWFKSDIDTKDVKFIRTDKNGDIRDDVEISTIVEGKIRMVEQEREIKANQFLIGSDIRQPLNIQRIRHLQIVPKKGIEARFSGRSKQIQIGLDPDFPVSKIQGSLLDSLLPRDAIIAIFSFGAATVANLLAWLFSNSSKGQSKPLRVFGKYRRPRQ